MLNLSIIKISGIMWAVWTCRTGPGVGIVSGYVMQEWRSDHQWHQEVGRWQFIVLLVEQSSGFPRFDEVARHFESAAFEVPRNRVF